MYAIHFLKFYGLKFKWRLMHSWITHRQSLDMYHCQFEKHWVIFLSEQNVFSEIQDYVSAVLSIVTTPSTMWLFFLLPKLKIHLKR